MSKIDDSSLGESVALFGGDQFPRAMGALGLASGWADLLEPIARNGAVPTAVCGERSYQNSYRKANCITRGCVSRLE